MTKKQPANIVRLRNVTDSDLPIFFEQQLDAEANWMAAFTAKEPANRDAFNAHWAKLRADKHILIQTILYADQIAGHVLSHNWFGEPEISYWVGKPFWGKGVATEAVRQFLAQMRTRPLFARAVKDNIASIRVLEKCGFTISGEGKGFANARNEEVEEFIFILRDNKRDAH